MLQEEERTVYYSSCTILQLHCTDQNRNVVRLVTTAFSREVDEMGALCSSRPCIPNIVKCQERC